MIKHYPSGFIQRILSSNRSVVKYVCFPNLEYAKRSVSKPHDVFTSRDLVQHVPLSEKHVCSRLVEILDSFNFRTRSLRIYISHKSLQGLEAMEPTCSNGWFNVLFANSMLAAKLTRKYSLFNFRIIFFFIYGWGNIILHLFLNSKKTFHSTY